MSEIKEFYYSIPPFSRYYLSAIFAISFMLTYVNSYKFITFNPTPIHPMGGSYGTFPLSSLNPQLPLKEFYIFFD